jgi:hypothetical protein
MIPTITPLKKQGIYNLKVKYWRIDDQPDAREGGSGFP